MAFGVLAGQITVIFLEVLLGYVGARSGIIKDRDSKFLSDFIMKLLLPCTMLAGAAVDGEPELLTQAGVLFVLLLALFVVTTGLCRLSSWLHHDTPGKYAVLVGTAAMPNCGFIGLPLCSALLGTARGTVFAGMAMASYNVWFFTYVVCLFRPGEKIRLKTFITPTNIATVAMLVLLATGWRLPAPVQQFCSAVGGCTTPLALMIVGVLLADSDIRALLHTGFLYRVTLLRGILFPLLFMLLLWLLPLDNVLRTGLSIIACCPAGSLAAVLYLGSVPERTADVDAALDSLQEQPWQFVADIPADRWVTAPGGGRELYCIFAVRRQDTLFVYEKHDPQYPHQTGRELYCKQDGQPILLLCNGSREDTNTMVTVYCSTGRPLDWNPQLSAETGRPVPVDGVYDFSNYPLTGAAP